MAITKLMHMNTSGSGNSVHLKNAIDYIMNENKTENLKWIGSQNCHVNTAFEDMIETKKYYGKTDGRQGYHFVISFKPGEGNEAAAYEIGRNFSREYLKDYEVIYAVHNDKDHIHTHIIFNSVSYATGLKYHYNDGDWERDIQPLVDRLCVQHGLAPLEYHIDEYEDANGIKHEKKVYSNNYNWNDVIRKDIDACIDKSVDFDDFIARLKSECNYRINHNERKYITVKAPGMKRGRRLKASSLGDLYSEETIRLRIEAKNQRYTYADKNPVYFSRTYKMPRTEKVKFIKYENMTDYQKERLKAAMVRRKICKTNGAAWYKKEKSSQFYIAIENYYFAVKSGFKSQKDVIDKYNELNQNLKTEQGKRNRIRHDLKEMKMLLTTLERATDEYETLAGQIERAEEELSESNTGIKNLNYNKYRCRRLLSDDAKEIVEQYERIIRRKSSLEKDIYELKLRKKYKDMKDERNYEKTDIIEEYKSENPNLVDITITKQIIEAENESAIKTRIPGTWGESAKYLWTERKDIIEIHNGKTMLTFLDKNKKYKLYDDDDNVIAVVTGEGLYSAYDHVKDYVRKHYDKEHTKKI